MHCHCGTYNKVPKWTFKDPLKPEARPGAREESASPVWQLTLYTELDLHRIMSGFHGAFATGVASQQGTLTLPDTWFRPPFWDLLMLQLLRPNSSNLPCLCSTFHLEYPLVLSRFYFTSHECRQHS